MGAAQVPSQIEKIFCDLGLATLTQNFIDSKVRTLEVAKKLTDKDLAYIGIVTLGIEFASRKVCGLKGGKGKPKWLGLHANSEAGYTVEDAEGNAERNRCSVDKNDRSYNLVEDGEEDGDLQ